MTEQGALAITGVVLIALAFALAFVADTNRDPQPYAGLAWALTIAGAAAFIGAAWWQAVAS